MKRQWIFALSLMLLVAVSAIAFGVIRETGACAESASGQVYSDEHGNRFRIVPLNDGRYELWQLVDEQKGSGGEITHVSEEECRHEQRVYSRGNDQFHWEECLACGKLFPPEVHVYNQVTVVKAATCKENAVLKRTCVCGREDERNTAPAAGDPAEYFAHHTWGGSYESDHYGHWQHCVVCGERDNSHAHEISNLTVDREPTCLDHGKVSFDCAICGEHLSLDVSLSSVEHYPALQPYLALGHDFSGPLKVAHGQKKVSKREEGDHAASCIRCGAVDLLNPQSHAWAEYTIANGTCEDESDPVIIGGTCECGATLELSYIRHHQFVKDSTNDVPPTCTEPGKINGERCLFCGIFGNYDFAEPLGHDWWEDESLHVNPTCETMGEKHMYCSRCDTTETRLIHTLSEYGHHLFVVHVIQEAKCGEIGWWEKRCKYCDQSWDEGIVFEKLEHDNVTTIKDKELDLRKLDNGTIVRPVIRTTTITCSRCGKTRMEEFTIYKAIKGTGFAIKPGRDPGIEDLQDGFHPSGQFSKDPLFFESEIEREFHKILDKALEKYKDD